MDNFLRRQSQLQSQSGEAKFKPPSVELKDLIACRQMERAFEERGRKCATDIASSHDKMQWVFQEIVGRTPRGIKGSAIKDLTELRNSIVHRRDQESKAVSTSEVGQAFTALFELVEDLGTIAVEEHFSYVEWPESVTREINRLRIMMDQ
jgi:hypothetical protein